MNEHEKTVKAAQQVAAITGFYIHLAVFVLVMVLLLVGNRVASRLGSLRPDCLSRGVKA